MDYHVINVRIYISVSSQPDQQLDAHTPASSEHPGSLLHIQPGTLQRLPSFLRYKRACSRDEAL